MKPRPEQRTLRSLSGWLALGLLVSGLPAQEEDAAAVYRKAAEAVEADLATALEQLAETRTRIAAEKPDLAAETAAIAADLRVKRHQAELARQERDALLHDLQSLSNEVRRWRDEAHYIDGLLAEFRKQFEADLHPAEAAAVLERSGPVDAAGEAGLEARTGLAGAAADRLGGTGGILVLEGEALDAGGMVREGRFLMAGPVSWFVSADGKVSGLTDAGDGLMPRVVPGTADGSAIARAAEGGGGVLRFDPTLGSAVALDQAGDSLADHIRQGGLWIYPILALALAATLAALAKWFQLLRIRDVPAQAVGDVLERLRQGNREEALGIADRIRHPARALLRRGIELSGGGRTRDEIEEALYEQYLEAQPPLQRGLPIIAIASASAPLLGLLGTVTGMIHTFKLINIFGTGDAKSLASGISEALITTEFGLIVAIPALILHAFLSRRVQGIRSALEMTSLAFLNGLETEVRR